MLRLEEVLCHSNVFPLPWCVDHTPVPRVSSDSKHPEPYATQPLRFVQKKISLFRFTNLRVSIDFIKKQINYLYVFIIVLNAYLSHENSCVIKQW